MVYDPFNVLLDVVCQYFVEDVWYIYTMEFYAAERKKVLIPFAMA